MSVVTIKRNKSLGDINARDLVNYFASKYCDTNNKKYPIIYARDCTLMGRVLYNFEKEKKKPRDIFKFIDIMFAEYHNRLRAEDIDIRFLLHMSNIYLHKRLKNGKKVKTPDVILDDDIKKWLQKEKKKWNL